MKKLSKIVSVVLSLALCLGMASPAFAASFDDLQNAINAELPSAAEPAPEVPDEPETPAEPVQKTEDGSLILGTDNHYGFGWNQTDNRFGIEAWDDAETGRNVLLKETVEHEKGDKVETITIDDKVNLDLNENTLKGQTTWKPIITVSGEDASLTLEGNGTVSGVAQASDGNKITHGLSVKDGASLTMKSGTLTDFYNAVVVEGGSTFTMEDGKITNNNGAGVRVKGEGSSFTMENGTISENNRGSVRVTEGAFFEMKDGTITKNSANGEHGGGSVYVEKSTFEMSGGSITDSLTGGIIGNNSTIKLVAADPDKPIEISNNKSIGVQTYGGSTLTMDGVIVKGNTAGRGSGINTSGDKEVTLKNVTLEGNKGGDSAFFSWKTENVKIEDSTIKDNESSMNTVWICYNTAEIKNSDIDGNGGANAIGAEYGVKMTVNGKTLYGSYADKVGSDGTISGIKNNYSDFGATILVLDEDGNTVSEIKLPQGGKVDKDGNIISDLIISKTFNEDETTDVTITSKDREDKFTIPTDKQANVKLDKDGVLTGLPENSVVITTDTEGKITETKLPQGGGIDADGNFTGDFVISKTDNSDDTTTAAVTANGHVSTIIVPTKDKDSVELGEDGNTTIPEGCMVIKEDGSEIDLPHGGLFKADGTYAKNPHTYANKVTKEATCTEAGERADVCSCGDKKNVESIPVLPHTEAIDAAKAPTCTETGLTEGKHCDVCGTVLVEQVTVEALGHTEVIDPREEPTTTSTGLTEGSHCGVCGEVLVAQKEIPMLPSTTPVFPVAPDDGTGADATSGTTAIEDQEVPLAGLMSVAQLLEELRQYAEIEDVELPEDFKWIDHEYAQAIYWGLQEELVADTEEEPFDPDEVVTVALLRDVLTSFVELYKGLENFVFTLEGEDDEIVMDLGERLTVFYGELEEALKATAA